MHHVAKAAGVSVSTVSRVLSNGKYVREDTKLKVQKVISELGFQPNRLAQGLRPGQTTAAIALVIEDIANPFSSAIAHGVEEATRQHKHLLVVGATERSFELQSELMREMVRRRVDGMLVMPAAGDHSALHAELIQWAPMVFIDRPPRGIDADVVLLDNRGGARQAVRHLFDSGHHRIGYVGGATSVPTGSRRLSGYRQAFKDQGRTVDPTLITLDHHDAESARDAAVALLASASPPTAIFADNNRMSVGVLKAAHESEQAIDVAGFDDLELAELLSVPVALVTYDAVDLGRRAAELLFSRIGGDSAQPRRITLPTSLVVHPGMR
jgi:LacI family transcriptional regulator